MRELSDKEILKLFIDRDERAIEECRKAYGKVCGSTAVNILKNKQDADGKPLYLNDPYMQDYYDCEQYIEKREKIEQEENNKKYHYGFEADLYESDKTGRISLTKEDYGRNKWLTKLFRAG